MTAERPPFEELSSVRLEERIRDLARRLFAGEKVDDLETWHLAQVIESCSRSISDIYRTVNLDQILRGEVRRSPHLDEILLRSDPRRTEDPLHRVTRVPDTLRGVADRCLYDIGMAGVRDYHGLSLETLGIRSYRMAADILAILANERDLRELFQRNRVRTLPIEEEIAFLRQCAARFQLYANLLIGLREPASPPRSGSDPEGADSGAGIPSFRSDPGPEEAPAAVLSREREPRERVLSRYERILLFAETDLEQVRRELKARVIDQDAAVDAVCDDLLLNATGTQLRGVPQSYFLVGPTGVGKNYLMESLGRILEEAWNVEIPLLVVEGPQYTYPSDINELKGATRGFIRSDEPGLLTEFHERSSRAPLSILVVDEVEKAHPQLQKFFLSVMDRGTLLDNRGKELGFEGTILAFTSNLGYSESLAPAEPIGYRGGAKEQARRREREAGRELRKSLSPEFVARLRVIRFAPLSRSSMDAILDLELAGVVERFRSIHGLEISFTPRARRLLVEMGFSEAEGARHLAAVVRRHCNVEVARRIKQDEIRTRAGRGDTIRYLREVRRGERAYESASVERAVREQARIRLPYRRLVVDAGEGGFRYTGKS